RRRPGSGHVRQLDLPVQGPLDHRVGRATHRAGHLHARSGSTDGRRHGLHCRPPPLHHLGGTAGRDPLRPPPPDHLPDLGGLPAGHCRAEVTAASEGIASFTGRSRVASATVAAVPTKSVAPNTCATTSASGTPVAYWTNPISPWAAVTPTSNQDRRGSLRGARTARNPTVMATSRPR